MINEEPSGLMVQGQYTKDLNIQLNLSKQAGHHHQIAQNTLATHLKYPSSKSDKAEMKTEVFSPAPKTQISIHKMSRSVNDTYTNKAHKHYRSDGRSKDHLMLDHKKSKAEKIKSKSQIILKNRSPKHRSHNDSHKNLEIHQGQKKKEKGKAKDRIKDKLKQKQEKASKSMSRSCKKINLESIIEQSSSDEQLVTPNHKQKSDRAETPLSQSRTKKKLHNEGLSDGMKRKIDKSFKEPQTFQKVLKTPILTVSYRILKKRLIQIEIYTLKSLNFLKVTLDKGNLQCQSINEQYNNVSSNTVLALFSSVRSIDIDSANIFPQIDLQVEEGDDKLTKAVTIPYSWLHFSEDRQPSMKKSKIKTKLCLSDIPINSSHLNILSCIFQTWLKKTFKGSSEFETCFSLCEQEYTIKLVEQPTERFTLELEGKGEARLTNMIQFIQQLIS